MTDSEKALKNFNQWENKLDGDCILADPAANDFKNADDAIDLIKDFINAGYDDPMYKNNIREIRESAKHGDYLYTDDEGCSLFHTTGYMSVKDFKNYDEIMSPGGNAKGGDWVLKKNY